MFLLLLLEGAAFCAAVVDFLRTQAVESPIKAESLASPRTGRNGFLSLMAGYAAGLAGGPRL